MDPESNPDDGYLRRNGLPLGVKAECVRAWLDCAEKAGTNVLHLELTIEGQRLMVELSNEGSGEVSVAVSWVVAQEQKNLHFIAWKCEYIAGTSCQSGTADLRQEAMMRHS
jgi:hypothetical protein